MIPSEVRKKLKLKPQQKLLIETTDNRMVLRPEIRVEEFIAKLKGCISSSSSAKKVKAEELKQMWSVEHSHHYLISRYTT